MVIPVGLPGAQQLVVVERDLNGKVTTKEIMPVLFSVLEGPFSEVLAKIKEMTKAHPHCKRGPTIDEKTRFRYVFGNPTDHNREIILTVMVFDFPKV